MRHTQTARKPVDSAYGQSARPAARGQHEGLGIAVVLLRRGYDNYFVLVPMRVFAFALVGASLLVACGDDDLFADTDPDARPNEEDTGESEPSSLELERLSYHLDWETTAVDIVDGSVEIVTDLGFRVRLEHAYSTVYSVVLVPCYVNRGARVEDWLARLGSALASRVAFAGHDAADDPSASPERFVEDLTAPTSHALGEVDFPLETYCQLHFAYGPPNASSAGLPGEPDIVGKSLFVQGSWQAPGDPAWTEFGISVSHANGKLMDFSRATIGELGPRPDFRLIRDWRVAFNGVDFATTSQWDLDLAVLSNLVASARLEIGVH